MVCAHHVFASPGTWRRGVLLPTPTPSARGAPSPSRRRAGRGTERWLRLCRPCPAFLLPSPGPSGLGPRATPENPHLPGGGAGRGCGSRPEAGAFRTCGSPGLPRVGETEAQTGYDCEPVEDIRGCRDWGEEGPPPQGFPAVRVCAATKWQRRSEINLQAKILGHTHAPWPGRPALIRNTLPHPRPLLPRRKTLRNSGPRIGRAKGRWLGHPGRGSHLTHRESLGHLCASFIHAFIHPFLKQVLSTTGCPADPASGSNIDKDPRPCSWGPSLGLPWTEGLIGSGFSVLKPRQTGTVHHPARS